MRGQNWTPTTATVEKAANSIPATKYEPNRLNEIAAFVNWSYISYEYKVGDGIYQHTEEMGPHFSIFDYMIGPLAYRFNEGDTIDIKYNEHNPKESVFGFDIFRPVETLGGTAMLFVFVGMILLGIDRMLSVADNRDTENMPY